MVKYWKKRQAKLNTNEEITLPFNIHVSEFLDALIRENIHDLKDKRLLKRDFLEKILVKYFNTSLPEKSRTNDKVKFAFINCLKKSSVIDLFYERAQALGVNFVENNDETPLSNENDLEAPKLIKNEKCDKETAEKNKNCVEQTPKKDENKVFNNFNTPTSPEIQKWSQVLSEYDIEILNAERRPFTLRVDTESEDSTEEEPHEIQHLINSLSPISISPQIRGVQNSNRSMFNKDQAKRSLIDAYTSPFKAQDFPPNMQYQLSLKEKLRENMNQLTNDQMKAIDTLMTLFHQQNNTDESSIEPSQNIVIESSDQGLIFKEEDIINDDAEEADTNTENVIYETEDVTVKLYKKIQLAQPQTAKDIENFYVESVIDNNIPRGGFIDASSLFYNTYSQSNSKKQQQENQKLVSDTQFYKSSHLSKSGDDEVEWLSPGRRKPVVDTTDVDKNLNKLEHQLGKLHVQQKGEQFQEEQKKIFLRPSNSGSLEDYNVIQTQMHQQEISLPVESLHKVDDDNNNNNNNNDNDDDCDNNNNKKSGDNKRVNVWKQVELFQAGNAISKNWSLTVQELVLDTEFEQQDRGVDDDVMGEQQQVTHDDDNVVTIYFRLLYRRVGEKHIVYEQIFTRQLQKDCVIKLKRLSGEVDQTSLPYRYRKCTVVFPTLFNELSNHNNANPEIPLPGLLVQLTRLNIPCNSASAISFSSYTNNNSDNSKKICGKLEEYSLDERTFYFKVHTNTTIQLFGSPFFRFNYKLVDYCYNVTLSDKNNTIFLQPQQISLECNFKIHLPYGNRISFNLITNNYKSVSSSPRGVDTSVVIEQERIELNDDNLCRQLESSEQLCKAGELRIAILDAVYNSWCTCVNVKQPPKLYVLISSDNILAIHVIKVGSGGQDIAQFQYATTTSNVGQEYSSLFIEYNAIPIETITSPKCAFGWVNVNNQFCVTAMEQQPLTWQQAADECERKEAKLAAIRSESDQHVIDQLIMKSPGYKDTAAYWIGASDKHFEGYYRWIDGLPLTFMNWFPGWSQHNNYNRQPNDDGLSQEDCVEIRRYFRTPPSDINSPNPLLNSYMWNDRNCEARNFFLCETPISDDSESLDWKDECNKTIFLSKEHPRTSVWSPAFPKHYPDNFNCLTLIFAPAGYRLVIDFEELVVENEPTCGYDFVEVFEPHPNNSIFIKSPLGKNLYGRLFGNIRHSRSYLQNEFFLSRSFLKFDEDENEPINMQSYVMAHSNVEPGQYIFRGKLSRKMCGDWSAKLKLLRYVTQGTVLGIHFISDYSHHFSGYKAKITMESVGSDCMDERFIPYNGSCFLFVFYPEVDWLTAQNACRGIGTQLASVTSKEEENFVVNALRNSLDFSPQALYWVGGELADNGRFEWVDGSEMKLKGIMSAQVPVQGNSEQICLGLQTKASMGAGLHWVSKPCTSIGGYVCKRKASVDHDTIVQNQTINDSYGRLTSPSYPNQYPVNINYWITISGPDNTRIILQFQKIDIETQEECLYDYIGLNNIDSVLHSYVVTTSTLETNSSLAHDFNSNTDTTITSAEDIDTLANEFKRTSWKQHSRNSEITVDNRQKRYWTPKNEDGDNKQSHRGDTIKKSSSSSNNNNNINGRRRTGNYTVTEFYKVDSLKIRNSNNNNNNNNNNKLHGMTTSTTNNNNDDAFDTTQNYLRLCGAHEASLSKYNFISRNNEMYLHFHSDFSITGSGYSLTWNAVDTSGCPYQTLTAHEGFINTPNYPHFLLNNLDCTYVIQAPHGKRVLIEFTEFDVVSGAEVKIDIGDELFRPFAQKKQLNDGVFVTNGEKMVIKLQTGEQPRGKGFRAIYKTMNSVVAQKVIDLANNSFGRLYHLNYPQPIPVDIDYTQHIIAPVGKIILLELHGVSFSKEGCHFGSSIEVLDNYADNNGTWWELCDNSDIGLPFFKEEDKVELQSEQADSGKTYTYNGPIHIRSYLNTLHIRQKVKGLIGAKLNATVFVQPDEKYKVKLLDAEDDSVESCVPNPCLYSGRCITNGEKRKCQCKGHFVGKFCALNVCELEPCIYGQCELTPNSFKCHCQPGYSGTHCDLKQDPCEDNPCENRGECSEHKGTFHCRCHAWWEGRRCEKRMRVPFKPLSERMLQEPFWLGLITVFVVLGVIGLVWCAKRHFPEKIEKLIAEESERNRPTHGYHNHPSLREQLHLTSLTMNTTTQSASVANTPAQHRSIFGRLGIRKPSILSLSSPHTPGGATARTFSLDDLLRPPPRRTPSPRKKRNNSTPSKKSAVDKKQILQQLVSPAASGRPKVIVSLDELIHLSERMNHLVDAGSDPNIKETTFSESNASAPAVTLSRPFSDPKLEKKVTFARLLSKVSHEMSSGSEMDIRNQAQINNSLLSIRMEPPQRANSVPPSPSANDIRSPHSTSSNQGSASLSSSELALADLVYKDIRPKGRPKTTSADSILAMFKNFAVSNAGVNLPSSIIFSPSTTPDETSYIDPGDDDTSTSEAHTPISFSSTAPDSPIFYRQSAIEVPVMDNVSAHKATSSSSNLLCPPTILLEIPNSINKCLSPIRELPTPMPSPAITPIMPRAPSRPKSPNMGEETLSVSFSDDDEDGKTNVKIDITSIENDQTNDINPFHFHEIPKYTPPAQANQTDSEYFAKSQKPQKPKLNLIQKQIPAISISIEADFEREVPVPAVRPTNLIIPTLMIQTPSPTMEHKTPPVLNVCPGSPPPQNPSESSNCTTNVAAVTDSKNFVFPPSKAQQKKLSQHQSETKSASLDFPFVPPLITITTNIDDTTTESDAEFTANSGGTSTSSHTTTTSSKPSITLPSDGRMSLGVVVPHAGGGGGASSGGVSGGMCYLSPFSICTRGDRAPSESNLSSSGYSSMASPGPSRCGSNNPLFPSEMDDAGTGPPGSGMHSSTQSSSTRRHIHTSILKKPQTQENNQNSAADRDQLYRRSDSETLSDDPLIESNDEGIGTDHLDEKIEEGKIKSAKELENYISTELIETGKSLLTPDPIVVETLPLAQLQLPSIVIQSESGCDKPLSPVSSRSESPLSDRNAMGKFSSLFFGKVDQQLPFTDSDGLYDFPSSDGKGVVTTHHRKNIGRRRERKSSRAGLTSPSKSTSHVQLDLSVVPMITVATGSAGSSPPAAFTPASGHHPVTKSLSSLNVTRKSPKRRYRCPVASSSSSESLSSTIKDTMHRSTRALRLLARDQSRKLSRDSDDDVEDATPLSSLSHQSSHPSSSTKLKNIPHSTVKFTQIKTNDDDNENDDDDDDDEVDTKSQSKSLHFAKPLQAFGTSNNTKVSRLRAIGHQIRFLRRLEKSIKSRTQFMAVATSDSGPEVEENSDTCPDSPKITSPLLKQTSGGTQNTNQNKPSHVLIRQKASYKNSVDI